MLVAIVFQASALLWRALFVPAVRRRAGLLMLLGLLGWPERAAALDPARSLTQYNVRTWRRMNRLPSDAVNAIVQSGDGHLWLGTPRGLVDFDGVEFRLVGLPGQAESKPRMVVSLAPRREGGLWVGTERGGYGCFDAGVFAPLPGAHLGGVDPTTHCLLETRDGALFISTQGTLGRRDPAGRETELLNPADVMCLSEDATGRVWIGTAARGLHCWVDGRLQKPAGAIRTLLDRELIRSITTDHAGVIWVGGGARLYSFNPDLTPRADVGVAEQVVALLADRHGVLWVGTIYGGLIRLKDGVVSRITRSSGLASDHVSALAESADGSLWVGTDDGLTQLSDVKFPILTNADGLAGDSALTVVAAPKDGVWVGTGNGLSHLTAEGVTSYGANQADGFPSCWIRRILVARSGDLYLLGGQQELSRFRQGRVDRTWALGTWSQSIVEDRAGVVLTMNDHLVRLENDEIVPYRLADGREPAFGWINKLLVTRDGSLWVAANPGLAQIRDGKLYDWLDGWDEADRAFYDLCEDDDGGVWAVRNSGLLHLREGHRGKVDLQQGLYSYHIYSVVPDRLGNLWMDSPEGIFRVARSELEAVAAGGQSRVAATIFDGSHVVRSLEKVGRECSGCRSADGRIWLPSAKGVVVIDPAHLPVNALPPPIRLQRVLIDGFEYPVDRPPVLAAGVRSLEFAYGAIDYQAPELLRYRYRLEGFQDEWVDADTRRFAFFNNLPAGRYRFLVQACNADGVWNTTGADFRFTLPRHLHENWWFRAALALAGMGGLVLVWRWRERRRRREIAEIRHREELQSQMIGSSPVPMAMFDRDQRIVHVNAAFTRVLGYTADELPDLATWWRLSRPGTVEEERWNSGWRERLARAAAGSRSIEPVEIEVAHKDRTLRQVVVTTSAVGERTLLICADLTEHKRAEDERRVLEEQMRQGQKMEAIGRLSGGIAHDFNNLLTVILGNVSLLEMGPDPAEVTGLVVDIRSAARRAAELTRQMLAFSRKQPVHPVGLDLNHVATGMAHLLERTLGENIRLEWLLAAGSVPVWADQAMLEQVLLNLVLNARDAMPLGGWLSIGTALIEIAPGSVPSAVGARAGRFACLSVGDSGEGIAPEVLPHIFEPFFTTKDVGKGTGLGLATVYGIVQQHHGWVEVHSKPGRGSVFRLYLPLHEAVLPASAQQTAPGGPVPVARRCTILLVEDEHSVRTLGRRLLTSVGHRVFEADSGPAALQLWSEHQEEIELLFTDVMMPGGMNGLELACRLLAAKPALKVLYCSGYSADVIGGDFSGRTGGDFLAKPYTSEELLQLVERMATQLPK